ncbi:hypothetical protein RO3G_04191 [Rhizopus delemar RA 99-880]|uniref:Uncharacterized protein n=1 Tax=Rhizopus delemar (strain RA 99-880 / ATCC MYA-4621 / FGSC 9543 / NRRL 43880) TaxID=246409 RepID=I1BTF6_RHIO9|nr:hypothetical protein RO3G_04191 [Rhizopus delemar RA 99-880]|eukprot:EIE79486.1 hypothetical protein RO3G_04191 [Rhizopus delemar RA 99-880]
MTDISHSTMMQDTGCSMTSSLEKLDKENSSQRPIPHQFGNSEVSGQWNDRGIFVTKQTTYRSSLHYKKSQSEDPFCTVRS